MSDDSALDLCVRLARALRDEFGAEVEAYPGASSPEAADPVNRAFRAFVRRLVEGGDGQRPEAAALVSATLRRAAERRLAAEGWDGGTVRRLIEEEPGSPDDWLAFPVLSDRSQIEPVLDDLRG